MKPDRKKRYCLDCRTVEIRSTADGAVIYWCLRRKVRAGESILNREACSRFEPYGGP